MTGVDGSTSEGRAQSDRGQLESLVGQALEELRERTAAGEGDVGVALVELLTWMSDFLSCYSDRLADEAHLASAGRRISVTVEGLPWRQVQDLDGSSPDDPHFVVLPGDDGTRIIEFGDGLHGRRPPSEAAIDVRYRSPGQSAAVVSVEVGRLVVRPAVVAKPSRAWGIYPGLVVDRADPVGKSRVRVRLPALGDDVARWASACFPVGAMGVLPEVGAQVGVAFEAGDPSFPVWLGVGAK